MTVSHDDNSSGVESLPAPETEAGRLIKAVLGGTATAEDEHRLATLLDHPVVRHAFLAHLQLNGELGWRWRQPQSTQSDNVIASPRPSAVPTTADRSAPAASLKDLPR